MSAFSEIGIYVLQTLSSLYLTLIVLRFLFQLARADFYNPISQFIVKATNPPLKPLRKFIPGVFGLDMASLTLAILLQFAVINLAALIYGSFVNPLHALTWGVIGILSLCVDIFFWGMIVMIIVSFVAPQSAHPALLLLRQILEPLTAPFRKIIPPMGGLDLSPILVFMLLKVAEILIFHLAVNTGLPKGLVPGFY
jgi:YggT family protein